jgi:aspartyl-tRNA(Asn)/glutamyl-tRNA(Gln) amidotransferase subunit B
MMRSKEDAQDYRYFPDPDLLPLIISETFIDDIKSSMPELPEEKKLRYSSKMKISSYYSEVISVDKNVSDFFDKVALAVSPQLAASWLVDELFGHLNKANVSFSKSPVDPQRFIGLIRLIEKNTISGKIAKEVLTKMFLSKEDADSIVKKYGLVQISDHNTILEIVTSVLKEHSVQVEQYKGGKEKLLGFFVGKIMQKSKGKFNPKLLNDVLKEKLSN